MKTVYVVLTQTGTLVSKCLKAITGKPYNHSSISLDVSLNELYSFGRKKPNNVFVGSFIIEHINSGLFAKFPNTKALVLELEVSDEQYKIITDTVKQFIDNTDKYKYDAINLAFVYTKHHINRENRFFCSQFVAYVLNQAGISTPSEPEHIKPIDFLKLENSKIIYNGLLREYK